jgi:two-component system, LytTR family, response regulator LytT
MKILIVEDEEMAGRMLRKILTDLLGERIESIQVQKSLISSRCFLWEHQVDLLFLDLNLQGQDGFELLKGATAGSFHTIVVSAHTDRALEAFEYGVLDFVAKPFTEERIQRALERYTDGLTNSMLKYLSIISEGRVSLVPIENVHYIEACAKQVKIFQSDGSVVLCNKLLQNIEKILPAHYFRIHRSFIANLNEIREILSPPDRKYRVILNNGDTLPLSRNAYTMLKDKYHETVVQ